MPTPARPCFAFAAALMIPWIALAAQDDVANVASQDLRADSDQSMRFFLIGPKGAPPAGGAGLIVALPGGDGSAEFLPFMKRVFKNAAPDGFALAELVAPQWSQDQKIVWPTRKDAVSGKKFSTEDFVAAVVKDVKRRHKLDERRIFTLAWSSSGPAAYAISLQEEPPVAGSYIAMSVFVPLLLPPLNLAKGHTYYIEHSPDDKICVFNFAETARDLLTAQGAMVTLATYSGGHGWHGDVDARIRTGIGWLVENQGRTPPPIENSPAIRAQAEMAEKTVKLAEPARSTSAARETSEGAASSSGARAPGASQTDPSSDKPAEPVQSANPPAAGTSGAKPGPAEKRASNLLDNGGFEQGSTGWIIQNNSGTTTVQVDRTVKGEGNQSLRLSKTGRTGNMDVLRRNLSTLPKSGQLVVSALLKSTDARNAYFKFFIYDAEGNLLDQNVDIEHIVGSQDWRRVEKSFPVPENASTAAVMLVMVLDGTVWLDDVRVTNSK